MSKSWPGSARRMLADGIIAQDPTIWSVLANCIAAMHTLTISRFCQCRKFLLCPCALWLYL